MTCVQQEVRTCEDAEIHDGSGDGGHDEHDDTFGCPTGTVIVPLANICGLKAEP